MSSSRRRNRDDVGMNLFPFMAVLICTMGSLIMLLVVMVQQARVRAKETASVDVTEVESARMAAQRAVENVEARRQIIEEAIAKQAEKRAEHEAQKQLAEKTQQEIEQLRWQADTLRPSYEGTIEDLQNQRLALSHLEQHTRELSEQASRMQAEADLIAQSANQGVSNADQAEAELKLLTSQLDSAKRSLEREREKLAQQKTKYALVPYDGPSGTERPPIYIECLPDRVVMQPENVTLISEDFRAPLGQQNPMAMALRAKREFLFSNGLLPEGMEPYPLIVVRPGSASTYAAARSAMTAWESEFGYELVEADIELDYQPPDPKLATLLSDVVIEARGRRKMMFALMNRERSVQREVLRPSRTGGFETVSGGSSSLVGGSAASGSGLANRRDAGDGFGQGGSGNSSTQSPSGNRFAAGNRNSLQSQGAPGTFPDANASGQSQLGFSDQADPTRSRYAGPVANQQANGFQANAGSSGLESRFDGDAGSTNRFTANSTNAGSGKEYGGAQPPFSAARNAVAGASTSNGATSTGQSGGQGQNGGQSGGQGASGTGGPAMQANASNAVSASNFAQYQSLAQSRGAGWAIGQAGNNAVGLKRPIRIICESERLLLVPERGTNNELQIFRHDGSIPAVIDPFVNAVQARLEGWGIAGQGIFWRPVLQVDVRSDAEGRYRQLLQLLDKSGIEVSREQ